MAIRRYRVTSENSLERVRAPKYTDSVSNPSSVNVNMRSFHGVTAGDVFRLAADWLEAPEQKRVAIYGVDYSELHRSPDGSELLSIFFVADGESNGDDVSRR